MPQGGAPRARRVRAREVGDTGPSSVPSPQRQTNTRVRRLRQAGVPQGARWGAPRRTLPNRGPDEAHPPPPQSGVRWPVPLALRPGALQEGAPPPRHRPLPPASRRAAPGPQPGHWGLQPLSGPQLPHQLKGERGSVAPAPPVGHLRPLPLPSLPLVTPFVHETLAWKVASPTCCPARHAPPLSGLVTPVPGEAEPCHQGHTRPSSGKCQEAMLGMSLRAQRSAPGCGCYLSQDAEDGGT